AGSNPPGRVRYTRTRGPPPMSAVTATSARPSPSTSPAATNTPPGNPTPNGRSRARSCRVGPPLTHPPPGTPGADPTTMSGMPAPDTSPLATRAASVAPGTGGPVTSYRNTRGGGAATVTVTVVRGPVVTPSVAR